MRQVAQVWRGALAEAEIRARVLWRRGSVVGVVLLWFVQAAAATETRHWIVDTAAELLKGRGDGIAVTAEGRLQAVPGWQVVATLEEPVAMAAVISENGNVIVGTGNPARLYEIKDGVAELLTELPTEQVTAMLARPGGEILVAAIAPGAVYRWRDGQLNEVGRLEDGGFWALVEYGGEVIAAGGPPASLYRVTAKGLERWAELPDEHVRSAVVSDGTLLVGTSGKGLIVAVNGSGQMSLLYDSPFTEISSLVVGPDGSVWTTALVGEPSRPARPAKKSDDDSSGATETSSVSLDLPKVSGATATSEVLRLTPEGAMLKVHRFSSQIASAVAWSQDGLLVGTGYEGEVWRFVRDGGARLAAVDALQVVAILDQGSVLLTQGPAAVLRRSSSGEGQSRFRSEAERFARPVRFGEFRIDPPAPGRRIRFRSGAAEQPDETWMPWTEWTSGSRGSVSIPPARALQWELELEAAKGTAVERVVVAYREVNLAPVFTSVEVEDPGVIYLSGPPPSGPVIDLAHPEFTGIFTVIDEQGGSAGKPKQGKKYYRVGFRTVVWETEDPNQDPLRLRLEVENQEGFRIAVREDLETTRLALDTGAVPDGMYRFWITASDEPANPEDPLEESATSRWFLVDNSPPEIEVEARDSMWLITVTDSSSPLLRTEWSRDGQRWHALAPSDGLVDGQAESFRLDREAGRHLLVIRAVDTQLNRRTVARVEE